MVMKATTKKEAHIQRMKLLKQRMRMYDGLADIAPALRYTAAYTMAAQRTYRVRVMRNG